MSTTTQKVSGTTPEVSDTTPEALSHSTEATKEILTESSELGTSETSEDPDSSEGTPPQSDSAKPTTPSPFSGSPSSKQPSKTEPITISSIHLMTSAPTESFSKTEDKAVREVTTEGSTEWTAQTLFLSTSSRPSQPASSSPTSNESSTSPAATTVLRYSAGIDATTVKWEPPADAEDTSQPPSLGTRGSSSPPAITLSTSMHSTILDSLAVSTSSVPGIMADTTTVPSPVSDTVETEPTTRRGAASRITTQPDTVATDETNVHRGDTETTAFEQTTGGELTSQVVSTEKSGSPFSELRNTTVSSFSHSTSSFHGENVTTVVPTGSTSFASSEFSTVDTSSSRDSTLHVKTGTTLAAAGTGTEDSFPLRFSDGTSYATRVVSFETTPPAFQTSSSNRHTTTDTTKVTPASTEKTTILFSGSTKNPTSTRADDATSTSSDEKPSSTTSWTKKTGTTGTTGAYDRRASESDTTPTVGVIATSDQMVQLRTSDTSTTVSAVPAEATPLITQQENLHDRTTQESSTVVDLHSSTEEDLGSATTINIVSTSDISMSDNFTLATPKDYDATSPTFVSSRRETTIVASETSPSDFTSDRTTSTEASEPATEREGTTPPSRRDRGSTTEETNPKANTPDFLDQTVGFPIIQAVSTWNPDRVTASASTEVSSRADSSSADTEKSSSTPTEITTQHFTEESKSLFPDKTNEVTTEETFAQSMQEQETTQVKTTTPAPRLTTAVKSDTSSSTLPEVNSSEQPFSSSDFLEPVLTTATLEAETFPVRETITQKEATILTTWTPSSRTASGPDETWGITDRSTRSAEVWSTSSSPKAEVSFVSSDSVTLGVTGLSLFGTTPATTTVASPTGTTVVDGEKTATSPGDAQEEERVSAEGEQTSLEFTSPATTNSDLEANTFPSSDETTNEHFSTTKMTIVSSSDLSSRTSGSMDGNTTTGFTAEVGKPELVTTALTSQEFAATTFAVSLLSSVTERLSSAFSFKDEVAHTTESAQNQVRSSTMPFTRATTAQSNTETKENTTETSQQVTKIPTVLTTDFSSPREFGGKETAQGTTTEMTLNASTQGTTKQTTTMQSPTSTVADTTLVTDVKVQGSSPVGGTTGRQTERNSESPNKEELTTDKDTSRSVTDQPTVSATDKGVVSTTGMDQVTFSTTTVQPAVSTTTTDEPAVSTTGMDKPAVVTMSADQPVATTSGIEEPAVSTTETDLPVVSTSTTDKPAVSTSDIDEPIVFTTTTDEPAVSTTATDEPTLSTSATDQPAVSTTATDQPAVSNGATPDTSSHTSPQSLSRSTTTQSPTDPRSSWGSSAAAEDHTTAQHLTTEGSPVFKTEAEVEQPGYKVTTQSTTAIAVFAQTTEVTRGDLTKTTEQGATPVTSAPERITSPQEAEATASNRIGTTATLVSQSTTKRSSDAITASGTSAGFKTTVFERTTDFSTQTTQDDAPADTQRPPTAQVGTAHSGITVFVTGVTQGL